VSEHDVASTDGAPSVESSTDDGVLTAGGAADVSPVAAALAELDTLAERDLAEHPAAFERIHGQLHAALSAIDDA
jgi:hypothetical protein